MRDYHPHPIDTSSVRLNENLSTLVEFLAKNTHDNWAAQRMAHGWHYGPKRNDEKKEHPCLVPYEQLSESEKEQDRIAVRELLKMMILLGFRIKKDHNNTIR
jgi:hypothetical protein